MRSQSNKTAKKANDVAIRKTLQDHEDRKKKQLLLHKWDFIKEKKREFKEEAYERVARNRRAYRWNLIMHTYNVFAQIYSAYETHR
jgi:hypothetical protein